MITPPVSQNSDKSSQAAKMRSSAPKIRSGFNNQMSKTPSVTKIGLALNGIRTIMSNPKHPVIQLVHFLPLALPASSYLMLFGQRPTARPEPPTDGPIR